MNKSESITALADALSKAQAELKSAPFNRKNPFLNNRPYADLGSHIEAAKPILAKHGLALSQLVTSDADMVGVETVLMHKSGEWISTVVAIPPEPEKGKSFIQVAGSVISYFRRYSMAAILGMYSDEEDDGADTGVQTGTGQHAAAGGSGSATQPAAPAPATNGKTAPAITWTPKDAEAVVIPEGANKDKKVGDLIAQQLEQFTSALEVNRKAGKVFSVELERAYSAAKYLAGVRKQPQAQPAAAPAAVS